MKRLFYITAAFFVFQFVNAQINEFGLFLGGSNFIGDVGKTNFIAPNNRLAIGLLYKWNKSPRFSWRGSITHTSLYANDYQSDIESRKQRGYSFENRLTDITAGFEFNFFDFNLHETNFQSTPYIHTGVSYFLSENLYVENKQYKSYGSRSGGIAIPMIVGYKFRIAKHFILGLETGARYTFKDDIDGSFPKSESLEKLKFGNTNSKDWYVFTGATLTYTFGQKPCYCNN